MQINLFVLCAGTLSIQESKVPASLVVCRQKGICFPCQLFVCAIRRSTDNGINNTGNDYIELNSGFAEAASHFSLPLNILQYILPLGSGPGCHPDLRANLPPPSPPTTTMQSGPYQGCALPIGVCAEVLSFKNKNKKKTMLPTRCNPDVIIVCAFCFYCALRYCYVLKV